ncbi:hypothetical protein [Aestuariibacter sp. A3R04]|uniref:hypothetical protein n=1 Tax=Aestuariibacter sp. A3R04 TaxID=2841571 RepID=UPI001C086D2B|nr:hypothetical protein [Aestuariibacter sp. A3R04]MBU3020661.1 hypothetical protein [Aestuariibacter sp. A3R04]
MEINSVPFNQKEFLRGAIDLLSDKFGEEERFILNHKLDCTDLSLLPFFPTLNAEKENISIKKFMLYWFKEAEARGFVESSNNQHFLFTNKGLRKARHACNPVKFFFKAHWKFVVSAVLSFIVAIMAILRLIQC